MPKPPQFLYGLECMEWIVDGMVNAAKQATEDLPKIEEAYKKSNNEEPLSGWQDRAKMYYALDSITDYYILTPREQ